MEYQKFGNKYVLRLDKGDEVIESIKAVCRQNAIKLGTVTGIGAINKAVIGIFESGTKKYHSKEVTGDMEIASLTGNISEMNGEVYLHLHITLTDSTYKAFGGHLNQAVISCTGEIVLDVIEGQVDRAFSEEIGLNLIKFVG
ncbi:PPC domain-containing DNA-binding protein [Desulfofalx alkaliphila]|uniref:PPC domain-containing DNA-binding protein n=1 Tax=Desulfofalx alkaliphila TaxID=105483 RepID=UPI0004E21AC5|nr:PPC domain-containing DNA-binding protein [Desulfofalx alkaliphila]